MAGSGPRRVEALPPSDTGVRQRRPAPQSPTLTTLRAVKDFGVSRLVPDDDEARDARNARLRKVGTRVGSVAVAGVLIYAVFPVRTYLDQRAATRRAHEQIEVIGEQNERLEERVALLSTDDEIERIAREDYRMVRPGEEPYRVTPAPSASSPPETGHD